MAWKKRERPVRLPLFNREAPFAMLTWSLPPTSSAWLWFFPACATSGTRFFHRRFLPMIRNVHHLHFAAFRNDFGTRHVSVCVEPCETGTLGHSVYRVLKLDLQSIEVRQMKHGRLRFLPRHKLRGKVAEIKIYATGAFNERKQFNHQHFVIFSQPKNSWGLACVRSKPHLFRRSRSPFTFPGPNQPR